MVPYQVFPVTDGHIIIACGNDSQFGKLCAVLGDPAMAQEPLYKTNTDRVVNRTTLIPRMTALTMRFAKADIIARLEAVQVPAGPINTLADVFADPQVIARGMRIERPSAAAKDGKIPGIRTPIKIDGVAAAAERASPRLGEHTAEVLREIGEA